MPCRLPLALVSLALLLAACSSDRPLGAICKGLCPKPDGPVSLMRSTADEATAPDEPSVSDAMASDELKDQIRGLMKTKVSKLPAGVPERALADLPLVEDARLRLLALSSGGPFGALAPAF